MLYVASIFISFTTKLLLFFFSDSGLEGFIEQDGEQIPLTDLSLSNCPSFLRFSKISLSIYKMPKVVEELTFVEVPFDPRFCVYITIENLRFFAFALRQGRKRKIIWMVHNNCGNFKISHLWRQFLFSFSSYRKIIVNK